MGHGPRQTVNYFVFQSPPLPDVWLGFIIFAYFAAPQLHGGKPLLGSTGFLRSLTLSLAPSVQMRLSPLHLPIQFSSVFSFFSRCITFLFSLPQAQCEQMPTALPSLVVDFRGWFPHLL